MNTVRVVVLPVRQAVWASIALLIRFVVGLGAGVLSFFWIGSVACSILVLVLAGITHLAAPHATVTPAVRLAGALLGEGVAVYLVQQLLLVLGASVAQAHRKQMPTLCR